MQYLILNQRQGSTQQCNGADMDRHRLLNSYNPRCYQNATIGSERRVCNKACGMQFDTSKSNAVKRSRDDSDLRENSNDKVISVRTTDPELALRKF